MEKVKTFGKFYLDKEKDIIVNLYKISEDEIEYILETPNHKKGTLITNLAKICKLEAEKNDQDMKIIKGQMQAMINGNNEEVYVFRLGGIKLANIYNDRIEIKAQIPAISKTLMSQTKNTHTYECNINTRLLNSIRNKTSNKISIILHKKIKLKNVRRTRKRNHRTKKRSRRTI